MTEEKRQMQIGDIVKFKHPQSPEEVTARYILIEGANVMGRIKMEYICDMRIRPIELVEEAEVELA